MAASCHLLTLLKPPPSCFAAVSSSSSTLLFKLSIHHRQLQPHKSLALRLPALHLSPPPAAKCLCTSSSYPQPQPQEGDLKQPLGLHSDDDEELPTSQSQSQEEEKEKEKHPVSAEAAAPPPPRIQQQKLPKLSIKEKKELASYAHGLGKKLKSQLVGKSGVTDSLAAAFVENLESNELLKVKIHNSCPGELPDVIQQLEVNTGSVAVGQIGRSVILYRPSISKLKAEEKKRQNQRIIAAKGFRRKYTEFQVKPAEFRYKPEELKMERREAASNFSGRGKRGTGQS